MELYGLYCCTEYYLIDHIKNNEMGRHAALMGERRVAYRVLVDKTVGKRQLGRPGCSWENNREN
jgi:hypothetical protein